jgi:hypothetical protein
VAIHAHLMQQHSTALALSRELEDDINMTSPRGLWVFAIQDGYRLIKSLGSGALTCHSTTGSWTHNLRAPSVMDVPGVPAPAGCAASIMPCRLELALLSIPAFCRMLVGHLSAWGSSQIAFSSCGFPARDCCMSSKLGFVLLSEMRTAERPAYQ